MSYGDCTSYSSSSGAAGTTRTTSYQYSGAGTMTKLISNNPDTGTQTTEWVYGVTTGQGSALNSNRLLYKKIFPEGISSSTCVAYTYNSQGQPLTMADQNGTIHAYTYDKLGASRADTVTTFGSGIDSTVGRLETGYNERRLPVRATSLDDSGAVIRNEVVWDYNDFNQLISEWQEHSGAVTGGSQKVQYTFANGSANTIRSTGLIYPDGTTIATDYTGTQASALSRPAQLSESAAAIVSWQYLGLGAVVSRSYDAASGTVSTLGAAAAGYPGIDRFGRLVETLWKHGGTELVHTQYGRNRASGIVWQRNVLAHAMSVATEGNYYWYDGLRQVTRHDRGDLTGSPYNGVVDATRQQQESFAFDQTGNWNNTTAQNPALDQNRSHNVANQITNIVGPCGTVPPQYDAAGNMTTMPRPDIWDASLACTWDAWNRLVKVRSCSSSSSCSGSSSDSSSSESSSSEMPSSSESSSSDWPWSSDSSSSDSSSSSGPSSSETIYHYDALTRAIVTATAAETRDYYFNRDWRAIEERVSGSVKSQYVWNPANRWDLIRRKRSVSTTLDETRFVLKDYLDPAAIIDESGTVTERYRYEAFGPDTTLAHDFSIRSTSECQWNFLYHAEFLDCSSGLYNYGYRFYHPNLGRWINRDPIGEEGGLNLYGFVGNDGVSGVDILGLSSEAEFRRDIENATGGGPCCTDEKVAEGRAILEGRFKRYKDEFDTQGITETQRGRPEEGGEAEYSCYNLNFSMILTLDSEPDLDGGTWASMSESQINQYKAKFGIPMCWSCYLENRGKKVSSKNWGLTSVYRDHWVVICEGRNQDGKVSDAAVFDIWKTGAIMGQHPDAEGGFREQYPKYYSSEFPQLKRLRCGK